MRSGGGAAGYVLSYFMKKEFIEDCRGTLFTHLLVVGGLRGDSFSIRVVCCPYGFGCARRALRFGPLCELGVRPAVGWGVGEALCLLNVLLVPLAAFTRALPAGIGIFVPRCVRAPGNDRG